MVSTQTKNLTSILRNGPPEKSDALNICTTPETSATANTTPILSNAIAEFGSVRVEACILLGKKKLND